MTDKSDMEKVREISDIESDGPEFSCPYIDGVIKRYPDTATTLEYVREINSQLRYDRDGYKTMYLEMKNKDQEWRDIVGPLVEALRFYADSNNYTYFPATSDPDCMTFVGFIEEKDAGDKARQALAEFDSGK